MTAFEFTHNPTGRYGQAMGLGLQGGLYRLFLLLHILTAMVGFGAVAFNGMYRMRARQHGGDAELIVLEVNGFVTRFAEYLIYAVLVFGLLTSLTSQSTWQFGQSWLSAATFLYVLEIGLLHGVIHRSERHYEDLLAQFADSGEPTAEVSQMEQLEKRIRFGWAGFDVVFLIVLYLMVFTPGHARIA